MTKANITFLVQKFQDAMRFSPISGSGISKRERTLAHLAKVMRNAGYTVNYDERHRTVSFNEDAKTITSR